MPQPASSCGGAASSTSVSLGNWNGTVVVVDRRFLLGRLALINTMDYL